MPQRMKDILAQRARESFVGRVNELATLLSLLDDNGPIVIQVHGIAGIGKSTLLQEFSAEARSRGTTVILLDCGLIEPTPRGFLHELGNAIGAESPDLASVAERLLGLGKRVIIALDTYEVFRLLDSWLRQTLVPALGDNVRLALAGRLPPVPMWVVSAEWHGLFRSIALAPLDSTEAAELLSFSQMNESDAAQINRIARGHPLALKLAAAAVQARPGLPFDDTVAHEMMHELTCLYLADVQDPLTRTALEAVSVIRCVNQPLLAVMVPEAAPRDLFDRLLALPFVDSSRNGLMVHDAVREALAASLKASNPAQYRAYRRSAWRQLRSEVRSAGLPELWRYTADMLYLIEDPVVREGFFPSGAQELAVEPARPEDEGIILTIAENHAGPESLDLLRFWWRNAPESFQVVRDQQGEVVGFYSMFDPDTVNPQLLEHDPIIKTYLHHVQENPLPKNQRALFFRQFLGLKEGDVPSPIQGACWVDIKRTYMEMRPHLRRVYVNTRLLSMYAPALVRLGFQFPDQATARLDGATYYAAVLDMGPASVDGWLAGLVASELGVEQENDGLDLGSHEFVIDGNRISLTRLEFDVLNYLYQHEGIAVSRADLLENIWGYEYDGGSNVVDVLVRSLRKKMGHHQSKIQTVRGVGYLFRAET